MAGSSIQAIARPSPLLALTDLPRALIELGSLPWAAPLLARAPRGDGHAVLVLPGFVTGDRSTGLLRRYLRSLGHDARGWALGRNLGPRAIGAQGEKLVTRVRALHEETGRTVSLVGWSLGGVMARQVSRRLPEAVRQIVTLGAPFAGDPLATNVRPLYERLTGQRLDSGATADQLRESATPPPVPSTAIFSRSDGLVAWQNCIEPPSATTDTIEVRGSHCGLPTNPAVLYAVADRLAQAEGAWAPFDRSGRAILYPQRG